MRVICEKYKECTGCDCPHKTFNKWDGDTYLKMNYCHHIEQNIDFLTEKEIRKQKLEKINESKM